MRPLPVAVALVATLALPAPAAGLQRVSFSYTPPIAVRSVALVGSFNSWDRSLNPMKLESGRWVITLELAPGDYAYKFVVDGERYVTDPTARMTAEDGFGGRNALLKVAPPQHLVLKPAGELEPSMVRHRTLQPDRNRVDERTVSLRLMTRPGDARQVSVMLQQGTQWKRLPMTRFATTGQGDYYRLQLTPATGSLRYAFGLDDRQTSHFLGPDGLGRKPGRAFTWDWQGTPAFKVPDWARGAVCYQIFPERFLNGSPKNDPPGVVPWGAPPSHHNFMGGDLAGITARLDYLSDLGVDALYLNPIFEAPSNHKYDTADYTRIDPRLGTYQDFLRLSNSLHGRGMQLLLDGVFNHTGTGFAAFQEASARGPASPAFGWYRFDGFPVVQTPKPNYKAWWGFASLPQLNHANPEVRDYLAAVGTRWMGPGLADGWRLDVPNEVPRAFWAQFRQAVREVRPEALLVGELWADGSPWLQGDAFDSVMNYRFRAAMLDFFASEKIDAHALGEALDQIRADYPDQVEHVLFNLLDSHDTPRFLREARDDKTRLRLASFMQFTLPGMPVIYYGDEVGMTGGADPDNRRAMIWDTPRQDQPLLAHYQRLIRMRHAHPALRAGEYVRVETGAPRVVSYRRIHPEETLLMVINASTASFALEAIGAARDTWLYPSSDGTEVPPMSAAILVEGDLGGDQPSPLEGDQATNSHRPQ